jgi:hypothetical protein
MQAEPLLRGPRVPHIPDYLPPFPDARTYKRHKGAAQGGARRGIGGLTKAAEASLVRLESALSGAAPPPREPALFPPVERLPHAPSSSWKLDGAPGPELASRALDVEPADPSAPDGAGSRRQRHVAILALEHRRDVEEIAAAEAEN